jgi:hypothetical protein
MDIIDRENTSSDNSMENSINVEESFVVVCNDEDKEKYLEGLEKRNKKLENDYEKLEKRHGELLKLMNELLKIKPSNHVDGLDNLGEIRQRITQILYNEVRRHTVFSFTPILGCYNYFPVVKSASIQNNNFNVD